ncbi:hypothetical protein UFOVP573_40 [uncultured Caudovirales phage]|uniref:ParB/Sulfiredoxin n=1 Tax=uncultured Caudovirales phage TaxID=2100421 RepID=A0A6J5Q4A6_9CAUD|nr:hypothetical protein UFOVP288_75 [uncultured Caudovirales phage]CAB4146159.1 hypothetical protein UFOVP483_121 [uncultured Caudovirales phage]CAB4150800.1 hypothetical protein UFOVP573_40 [uncultured Caudovirales phage]CAB4161561.1 hypothetical protein UFOVP769_75 [uncultured Caudovirales phage]CAB4174364.1 hypothetical protein UFOVP962_43 [uncultured Caudovirales phage]
MEAIDFEVQVEQSEIKKNLNIPIFSEEKVGALFNQGHISKMSSIVKVSDLTIDYTYQRQPIMKKVNKIAKNFDSDILGVIICSMREDGSIAVIDGSHRVHALRMKGLNDSTVNALVYFSLSIQEEAKIFAMLNQEHTKPNTTDIFKAGIVSGDEETIAINKILNSLGLIIGVGPGDNKVRAISTIRRVYRNAGEKVLRDTLYTIKSAYGDSSSTMRDVLISAVAIVYNRYGAKVEVSRMITTLQKFGNPNTLIANAKSIGVNASSVTASALPFVIVNAYNQRLTKNRLSDYPMNLLAQQVWVSIK